MYSPPYMDVVMQKCCTRKSKVSSQICSTRRMGDTCLNNIIDKTVHTHKAFVFFYVIWASKGTPELPESCYFTNNNSRFFNNVHL